MTIPITITIITTKQRPEMGNLGKKGHLRSQSDPKAARMIYYFNSAAETQNGPKCNISSIIPPRISKKLSKYINVCY